MAPSYLKFFDPGQIEPATVFLSRIPLQGRCGHCSWVWSDDPGRAPGRAGQRCTVSHWRQVLHNHCKVTCENFIARLVFLRLKNVGKGGANYHFLTQNAEAFLAGLGFCGAAFIF